MPSSSSQEVALSTLQIGGNGEIARLDDAPKALRQRLLSMGFVEGTAIQVSSVAPLGDPITVKILGFSLALRRSEAKCVVVRPSAH